MEGDPFTRELLCGSATIGVSPIFGDVRADRQRTAKRRDHLAEIRAAWEQRRLAKFREIACRLLAVGQPAMNFGLRVQSASPKRMPMFERVKAPLRCFAVYRGLRFVWHVVTDGVFRQDQFMRLRRPGNMFQYRSLTFPDRYPAIFSFLQGRLASLPQPRVLSFGCATGDEVFSLARYLPQAFIRGVDVNARNISICRRRLRPAGQSHMEFAQQDSAQNEPPNHYDAVLCLAVFQHQSLQDPRIGSCERHIRFEAFDATFDGLARCLKPGGYLAIRHSDFRFEDAACSANFQPVLRIAPAGKPHPRFDRCNRRLPDAHDRDIVFQKVRADR